MKLTNPADAISVKHKDYQEHGTPIKQLIGREGMRVIGRAYDLKVIKEVK